MQKVRQNTKLAALVNNEGQLEWLPRNPRQWTQTDIDRTARSLENDPDFLEDRPLLLVALEDKFVVFAGNLRLTAARKLKLKSVPAILYTPETDEDCETIKRRAVLDNGSFGAWDVDALANEWDGPLEEWGVPEWVTGGSAAEDPGALDALFEEAGAAKPKPTIIEIGVPVGLEDKMEDIRAALEVTLQEWPGCKVL